MKFPILSKVLPLISAGIVSLSAASDADACTNILVSKGASADGSCMISYAADSHTLFGELYFHPAADWPEGAMLDIHEWDTGKYLGRIPQVRHTYQTVGNMNEHQLIIGESTFGGRPELYDSTGVMDYGSLIYVALQRAKTAREAIDIIVGLADTYGYCSSGESFSIADKDEVWVMELIGKGYKEEDGRNVRKGIVWVARRLPDGYICAHANQSRISTFPFDDPENCLYSPDVVSFAREMGYFDGKDEEFSFCDAYNPLNFGSMRGCEARAWAAFNILCDGKFTYEEGGKLITRDAYDFIDYAMGYDASARFPLFVKPGRKLTVKDVADVMRDHFEGTPMDMTTDIGAGGNALPYRWRPMEFEYEGKMYVNERAIATQQTGFWFVGQSRGWLPDLVGGLLWFGTDDAATSYLTPIYTSITKVPACFAEGNGSILEYSPTSAFWMCNRVANACYRMYNVMAPVVRAKADSFEKSQMELVREIDSQALDLYQKALDTPRRQIRRNDQAAKVLDPFSEVRDFLTDYSTGTAQGIFDEWVSLETFLLVKFMDGNVKAQNPDGSFVTNGYSDRIPDGITNPGYTDKWKEAVVRDHGEVLECR